MDKCGPKQWERMKILQTCERLEIPTKLWPKIPFPVLPGTQSMRMYIPNRPEKFNIPPFDPLMESIAEWREHCHVAFDETLDEYEQKFKEQFGGYVKMGMFTKLPQQRDTGASPNLRYEWAAQRLCYRRTYKELASGTNYNPERIKQAVNQILKDAGLKKVK
jgi:hypothetical protein